MGPMGGPEVVVRLASGKLAEGMGWPEWPGDPWGPISVFVHVWGPHGLWRGIWLRVNAADP